MSTPHRLLLLLAACLPACQTYRAAPVDLAGHAAAFAAALPTPDELRERIADFLPDAAANIDFTDGVSLTEARLLTLVLHPDCRLARQQLAVETASASAAGLWEDPQLVTAFQRILPNSPTPWLAMTTLGLSIPLTGRLGAQKELARNEAALAEVEARLVELRALDRLEMAWLQWSADARRIELLDQLLQRLLVVTELAERLAAAGEMTRTDARTFQLELVRRRVERQALAAEVSEARLQLQSHLGLHPEIAVELTATLLPPPRRRRSATEQEPGELPQLAQLWAAHQRAEAAHALAIRLQWADLQLFPGHALEDGTDRLAFGFTLPIPLWNGNLQQIRRTAAEREAAAEALRCGLERFQQDYALALRREQNTAAVQSAVTEQLLPLASQQVEDVQQLFALGNLDVLRILDALLRAHEARWQELAAAEAHALAVCNTNRLFWPDLASTPEDR